MFAKYLKKITVAILFIQLNAFLLTNAFAQTINSVGVQTSITPQSLTTEFRKDPRGLDVISPRLFWKYTTVNNQKDQRQTAFQIIVASSPALLKKDSGDLWNSGKVSGSQSTHITYQGTTLTSGSQCFWKVRSWSQDDKVSSWSAPASWTMGLLNKKDWTAKWIGSEEGKMDDGYIPAVKDPKQPKPVKPLPAPRYLRKEFKSTGTVKKAILYVSALGLYEVRLNGQKAGDHILAPEWTSYHNRVQYDALDVTALIKTGSNAIAAITGNGWYSGTFQFWPMRNRIFGDRPWFLAQLEIEDLNGKRTVINSDESWKVSLDGPLKQSGIYEGEAYDARVNFTGWDKPGFNETNWSPAIIANEKINPSLLTWQRNEPIRITNTIKAKQIGTTPSGGLLFDIGENISGWAKISGIAPAGTTATMKYAEALNEDGSLWRDALWREGENIAAIDRYTFAGKGIESYEPHFTYHGFRYIEVTGLNSNVKNLELQGRFFHSDLEKAGSFECSDTLVNKLASAIDRSLRSNFMGIPTDCNNRDERTGVTGDHQFFMPTAAYNRNVAGFFSKWLIDLCSDSQSPEGNFADIAPYYGVFMQYTQAWGDAGLICPYYQYRIYADTQLIRDHYTAIKKHFEFTRKHTKNNIPVPIRQGTPGDWLNGGGTAPEEVISTAYYAWMCGMMKEMAEATGNSNDEAEYKALQAEIKKAFVSNFIAEDGTMFKSSQTGYALAFNLDLVPESMHDKVAAKFKTEIERFNYHPTVGFIGVPHLLPALQKAGLGDEAYRLLLQKGNPSWLYMVDTGRSNTIWERWDSWTPEKGFVKGMNSLNHVVWGSMGEFLYSGIGGITAASPGYQKVHIEPLIGNGIKWAKTSYSSINGLIKTEWKLSGNQFELKVSIPPNTTAEVVLPGNKEKKEIGSGVYVFKNTTEQNGVAKNK